VRNLVFFVILLLSSNLVKAQSYVYQYVDPCTKNIKFISVPLNGANVAVTYYGQVGTFSNSDFTNGNFLNWLNQTSGTNAGRPCDQATTQAVNSTNMAITNNIISTLTNITSVSTMAAGLSANVASASSSVGSNLGNTVSNGSSGDGSGNGSSGSSKKNNRGNRNNGGNNNNSSNGSSNSTGNTQSSNSSGGNVTGSGSTGTGSTSTGGTSSNSTGSTSTGSTSTGGTGSTGSGSTGGTSTGSTSTGGTGSTGSGSTGQGSTGGTGTTGTGSNGSTNTGGQGSTGGTGAATGTAGTAQSTTSSGSGGTANSVSNATEATSSGGNGGTSNSVSNAAEATSGDGSSGGSGGKNGDKNRARTGALIGTGDIVAVQSTEEGEREQFRFTMSMTKSNTKNTFARGFLGNFTTQVNNSNITFYGAWTLPKSKTTIIAANSSMLNLERDFFNTTTLLTSKRFTKLSIMGGVNFTAGKIGETGFQNLSAVGGGFYMFGVGKKITSTLLVLGVYSPFTQFYEGNWWSSGVLIVPFSSWDYSITKKFKFNLSFSGTYELNKNMLNYQILTGGKILL
jgi:hypothetical protein